MRITGLALVAGLLLLGKGSSSRQAPVPSMPEKLPLPAPAAPKQTSPKEEAKPAVVTADPNPCLPGQTVRLYWPSSVSRVTVSGGSIAKPQPVPNTEAFSVPLQKTTTFTFDLWYPGKGKSGQTTSSPPPHQQEKVTVDVYDGQFPRIVTYHDPRHWRIDCLAGWNRYVTPFPDPANNTLIYFEPHEDSPERASVAIMPINKGMTLDDLAHKAVEDTAYQYDVLNDVTRKETTQCGVPALWMTVRGQDRSEPDVPVKGMAVLFIRDGKAYVISGRTRERDFEAKYKLFRCLIRSFAFEPMPAKATSDSEKSPKRSIARPTFKNNGAKQSAKRDSSISQIPGQQH